MNRTAQRILAGACVGAALLLAPALSRAEEPAPPEAPAAEPGVDAAKPLLIGEFELTKDPVVDADTIRILKPRENVRVIGLDAEEVFHKADDRKAAERDFAAYAKVKRGRSPVPTKYGTPLGEAAKEYVKKLLEGVTKVRLERDEVHQAADAYGRILAHVIYTDKEGKEQLLAEQVVREGYAPYFVKYGRSRRFDAQFVAAQEAAKAAKKGIWSSASGHYPDYPERLAWWEERAKQVDQWIADVEDKPAHATHIRLGVATETARLHDLVGQRVTLFGSLDRVEIGKATWPARNAAGAPTDEPPPRVEGEVKRILLVDRYKDPFPVLVFDEKVWEGIDAARLGRNFVRVSGLLTEHRGHLQIKLESAQDIQVK